MTHDPPHRNQPPRQERWPEATPAEPWPAYREDDSHPYGIPAATDRQGSHRATAGVGSRSRLGYPEGARAATDPRYSGHQPSRAPDPLPGPADPFPGPTTGYVSGPSGRHSGNPPYSNQSTWDHGDADRSAWDQDSWATSGRNRHGWHDDVDRDAGSSDYGTGAGSAAQSGYVAQAGYDIQPDYPAQAGYGTQAGYPTRASHGTQAGYDVPAGYRPETGYGDGFDGARVDPKHGRAQTGYADAAQGIGEAPDEYGTAAGYAVPGEFPDASQYTGTRENFGGARDLAETSYGYYQDPDDFAAAGRAPARAQLTAPDSDVYPEEWQSDQDQRWESKRRGLIVGAITGFLATATAGAISILAAAFVRPQASPILATYDAFIDRMPAALTSFTTAHFGTHGRDVLVLGLYVLVALLGLGIGMLARRAAALGVAGLAALCVLGAFVTITRPQGQLIDVLPSVAGGLAGVVALLWLIRASAPIVAPRPSRGDEPWSGR